MEYLSFVMAEVSESPARSTDSSEYPRMLKLCSEDAFVPRMCWDVCVVVPCAEMLTICDGRSARSYSVDDRVVAFSLARVLSVSGRSRDAELEPLAFQADISWAVGATIEGIAGEGT